MKVKPVLVAIVFILALTSCARSPESSIEQGIQRVEHGLLSTYGDPPWKRMELAERMAYYNVPGVSIAVINDYKVEWTRGYGVLEAGTSASVTPETLFQTASIAKLVVAVAALHFLNHVE